MEGSPCLTINSHFGEEQHYDKFMGSGIASSYDKNELLGSAAEV